MQGSIETQHNINCYSFNNDKKAEEIFSSFSSIPCISLNRKSDITDTYLQIKEKQGLIGKFWDGVKNLFNSKFGTKGVESQIEQFKKGQISEDELKQAVSKYTTGQKKAIDFASDFLSANIGFGAYYLAMTKGNKLSSAAGIAVSSAVGAITKTLTKYTDAQTGGREYKTLSYDLITGGIDGLLGPVAKGMGRTVTKESANKLGIVSKTIPNGLEDKGFMGIINQPKQKLEGGIIKRILARSAGQGSKTVVKYSMGTILREAIFLYIAFNAKRQDRIIAVASLFLPKDKVDIMRKNNAAQSDASNDIFSQKVESEN